MTATEALEAVLTSCQPLPVEARMLDECAGLMLAKSLRSPIAMPPFDQSAVDGYALAGEVHGAGSRFVVTGHVRAGDGMALRLQPGEAVRIFTGGAVPEGTAVVAMQEHCQREDDAVQLERALPRGANIRRRGEQVSVGEVALAEGSWLRPGALGFLAGLGITEAHVVPRPRVALLNSGNELVPPGNPLRPGQVYESNSAGIAAVLRATSHELVHHALVADDAQATERALRTALDKADALFITGGVSVGDHDHVAATLERIGVRRVFHKVNQKPGKPLWFGMSDGRAVFGLPGNPAAALTCLYAYGLPALLRLAGRSDARPRPLLLPLEREWVKRDDKTHFLKARLSGNGVVQLEGQGSDMLRAFTVADALVVLSGAAKTYARGEIVDVLLLPGAFPHVVCLPNSPVGSGYGG